MSARNFYKAQAVYNLAKNISSGNLLVISKNHDESLELFKTLKSYEGLRVLSEKNLTAKIGDADVLFLTVDHCMGRYSKFVYANEWDGMIAEHWVSIARMIRP